MGFIAYNTEKRAYLAMDACKRWYLTTDIAKAYVSKEMDRMSNITKAQAHFMPCSWRFDSIEKAENEPSQNVRLPEKPQIFDRFHPVRGEWKTTEEYNSVLQAVDSLIRFTSPEYAAGLRDQLDVYNNEIMDIEHYIEITPITVNNIWWICKRLKNARQKRRDIQQQLQIINRVNECKSLSELLDGRFEKPAGSVEKAYVPRSEFGEHIPWESKDQDKE